MAKHEDGSYGSLTGIALLGKVLAGRCGINYTRAAMGNGAIPEGKTPKTMEGCAGYVMDAKIASVTNPVDGECQVTVQVKSDDVQTGFYATNIVLFAEDPDEGEVPYTYLSLENEPEWIRPASSIVGKLATFDLIAAVGDVDAVTAVIDPEAIATIGAVEEMIVERESTPGSHATTKVTAEDGAHGFRIRSGLMQYQDDAGQWENVIDTGGLAEITSQTVKDIINGTYDEDAPEPEPQPEPSPDDGEDAEDADIQEIIDGIWP
ncbi:MAG: hypothetical protein IJ799_01640 [Bacteroidales bacterium]|nr:hypothetical protein [Bacteroidales bacterium]